MRKFGLLSVVLIVASSAFLGQNTKTAPVSQQPYPGTIAITVDASEAPTKFFSAKMSIPVTPGPITLLYPEWIPGEHGPTGPAVDLTGLKFSANGQLLRWRRDDVNMYAIHVDVPSGANTLDVSLDYTSPTMDESGFTAGATASAQLAVVSWNQMLLYPQGYDATKITYQPSVRIPEGWQLGTALHSAGASGNEYRFEPVSLYTLIDSPVITGHYFRVFRLTGPGVTPEVEMDAAADSEAALQFSKALQEHLQNIPKEAYALFGATHYRDYHFLFSLSDHVAHFGLEHHESNDSRVPERTMIDDQEFQAMGGVIPHEYVHSWNGKYRRPAGLVTPDYSEPMKGELLWVYEGLTEYLGDVLMARSGMWTPERYRENLASVAAELNTRAGRTWRPLIDTTIDAQTLYDAPVQWNNWRRGVDFYDEGELIWLDVDVTIRKLTNGKKSIDDFCHLFHGQPSLGENQVPFVKPYAFDDVVNALNQVAPYDWKKFFNDRLWSTSPQAPMAGVEGSGWKLTYTDSPSPALRAQEQTREYLNTGYSLGLLIGKDGLISDVYFSKPAQQAGITPGMKLIAVNGRKYSAEVLHDAIKAAKDNKEPIELLVQNSDYFKTYKLDYHEGEKYPLLQRNYDQPDILTDIIKPHAK